MPPGGIRTHNLSRRAAEHLRPLPRGHWDRQLQDLQLLFTAIFLYTCAVNWHFTKYELNRMKPAQIRRSVRFNLLYYTLPLILVIE